jgi:hypothetical protein
VFGLNYRSKASYRSSSKSSAFGEGLDFVDCGFEEECRWMTFEDMIYVHMLLQANILCLQDQKRELLLETMNAITP